LRCRVAIGYPHSTQNKIDDELTPVFLERRVQTLEKSIDGKRRFRPNIEPSCSIKELQLYCTITVPIFIFQDMHLLVPPLDDSCRGPDFGGSSSGTLEETGNSGKKRTSRTATRSLMSQGLQQQFETMKQAWNASRSAAGNRSESTAAESSIEEDRNLEEDHQNKKRRVAIETAFAIESEVQKWQRGIAELEAMLDEEGNAPRSSSSSVAFRPPAVVRFPSLPPIVPAEEGDFEKSCDEEDEESQKSEHCTTINDEQTEDVEQSPENKKDAIASTE